MIRSFVARASALLASATLAFLSVSPIAVTPASAGTISFPGTCSMADNGGGNFTMTCGATPPATFTCAIIGAPSGPVAVNTFVSLFMSCNGGTQPYRYAWSPGGATTATLQVSTAAAGSTTYSVTATDAANATSVQSATVTVTDGGGGGGGGGTGLCANYAHVLPTVNLTWGQQSLAHSSASGAFGDNTVWVFKLTVPAGTPNTSLNGYFNSVEDNGPGTFRQMTISTEACDFRNRDYLGVNGPLAVSNGVSATIYFGVFTPVTPFLGSAGLSAGQTYYISERNWQLDPTPQSSCGQTSCNAVMNIIPAQ